jgi:hypothetical protein
MYGVYIDKLRNVTREIGLLRALTDAIECRCSSYFTKRSMIAAKIGSYKITSDTLFVRHHIVKFRVLFRTPTDILGNNCLHIPLYDYHHKRPASITSIRRSECNDAFITKFRSISAETARPITTDTVGWRFEVHGR